MSTSVSSVTSHFPSAENGFTTTTSGSVSSGATTVGLNSVSGYANGEVVVLVIDPTDTTKKQTFTGVVDTAGVQITGVIWTAGTNQTHALGATVVDYATATHISMMTKGILVEHNQDGTHDEAIITSRTADASPADGDLILTSDASAANALKKATRVNFLANAISSGSIQGDAIQPAHLVSGTGTTWAWQSWTPTWTNLTVGNGTVAAYYARTGKTVCARIRFTMGSTSSMGTNPSFTLPVTAATEYATQPPAIGIAYVEDASVAGYLGFIRAISDTAAKPAVWNSSATYVTDGGLGATTPFTWATNDFFNGTFMYEAA